MSAMASAGSWSGGGRQTTENGLCQPSSRGAMPMSYPSDRKVPGPDVAGLLQGRTALVTGGGAGIGGAVSRRFAAAGARVALIDIDADRAAESVAEIEGDDGEALALVGDVRDVGLHSDTSSQAEVVGTRIV